MSKNKNHRIYSADHTLLKRIADEQENFIGRQYKLDLANNLLIIYAVKQVKPKKKKDDDSKPERNKRAESFQRNNR